MSPRSHLFISALAGALIFYELQTDSLGFICTWSVVVMLMNHVMDVFVDSTKLRRIKRTAFAVFWIAFILRLFIIAEYGSQFFGPWIVALLCFSPTFFLVWMPIRPPLKEEEDPVERL